MISEIFGVDGKGQGKGLKEYSALENFREHNYSDLLKLSLIIFLEKNYWSDNPSSGSPE